MNDEEPTVSGFVCQGMERMSNMETFRCAFLLRSLLPHCCPFIPCIHTLQRSLAVHCYILRTFACISVLLAPVLLTFSSLPSTNAASTLRERLSLHKSSKLAIHPDSAADVAGLEPDNSACSCYRIRHPYCARCAQAVCVCHNVCFNGSAILGNFGRRLCMPGRTPPRPAGGVRALSRKMRGERATSSPLQAVSCRQMDHFQRLLKMTLREASITNGFARRFPRWRKQRRAIRWREGTTYVQPLNDSCVDHSAFLERLGHLLLINNASSVARLPYHVDRFMFPRSPSLLALMKSVGRTGWHVNLLRYFLARALKQSFGSNPLTAHAAQLSPRRFIGTFPLLKGAVEFEPVWTAASETHPLCFDRVVLPGRLKYMTYVGGADDAEAMQEDIRVGLHLPLPAVPKGNSPRRRARWRVNLLLLAPKGGPGSQLSSSSLQALLGLLKEMNFKVTQIDPTAMPLRAQYGVILASEVILGLHGPSLATPSSLARNRSVLVEIMPHNIFRPSHFFASASAGLTYMLHMCRAGKPQPGDEPYLGLSFKKCAGMAACTEYFAEHRTVHLTKADLDDIHLLLGQARLFVVEARWNLRWAGQKMKRRLWAAQAGRVVGGASRGEGGSDSGGGGSGEGKAVCIARKRDPNCRMDLIRATISDTSSDCVLQKECQNPESIREGADE